MKCPKCQQNLSFVKETNQDICYHCGYIQPHIAKPKQKLTKQDRDLAVIAYKKLIFVLSKTPLKGFYNLLSKPLTGKSIKEGLKSLFYLLGSIYLLGLGYRWIEDVAFQVECGQYEGQNGLAICELAKIGDNELTDEQFKYCTCNGINPYL